MNVNGRTLSTCARHGVRSVETSQVCTVLGRIKITKVSSSMEETLVGLLILTSTLAVFAFVLTGCMERRLTKLGRLVRQIEDDSKYVN